MKRFRLLLSVLTVFLSLGIAQHAIAQGRVPSKRNTVSPRKKPTTTTQPTINVNFKGELGRFELRGPVKKCVVSEYETVFFNRDGFLTDENGKLLSDKIVRDNHGRIVEEEIFNTGVYTYKYNTNGLLIEKKYERGSHIIRNIYTYNSAGECIKNNGSGVELGKKWKDVITYTILTRDNYGNWTKRKGSDGGIETRTITYYK